MEIWTVWLAGTAAIFFAFQTGYWIGRRQVGDDKHWDWKPTALNEGWVHQRHIDDPRHYTRSGDYIWRE
jgi:membrane protein DedA with SNARE-associated domain